MANRSIGFDETLYLIDKGSDLTRTDLAASIGCNILSQIDIEFPQSRSTRGG